jgi:hypothetical protein
MNEESEDDRTRARHNVGAAIVLLLLFVGGLWLVFAFKNYVKTEECLEAAHRNCAPLDLGAGR